MPICQRPCSSASSPRLNFLLAARFFRPPRLRPPRPPPRPRPPPPPAGAGAGVGALPATADDEAGAGAGVPATADDERAGSCLRLPPAGAGAGAGVGAPPATADDARAGALRRRDGDGISASSSSDSESDESPRLVHDDDESWPTSTSHSESLARSLAAASRLRSSSVLLKRRGASGRVCSEERRDTRREAHREEGRADRRRRPRQRLVKFDTDPGTNATQRNATSLATAALARVDVVGRAERGQVGPCVEANRRIRQRTFRRAMGTFRGRVSAEGADGARRIAPHCVAPAVYACGESAMRRQGTHTHAKFQREGERAPVATWSGIVIEGTTHIAFCEA